MVGAGAFDKSRGRLVPEDPAFRLSRKRERPGDESGDDRCSAGVLSRNRGSSGRASQMWSSFRPTPFCDRTIAGRSARSPSQRGTARRGDGRQSKATTRACPSHRQSFGESGNGTATNRKISDVLSMFVRDVVDVGSRLSRSGSHGRRSARDADVRVYDFVPQRDDGERKVGGRRMVKTSRARHERPRVGTSKFPRNRERRRDESATRRCSRHVRSRCGGRCFAAVDPWIHARSDALRGRSRSSLVRFVSGRSRLRATGQRSP